MNKNTGAWGEDERLVAEDLATFEEVMPLLGFGVNYYPYKVKKQLVSGMNYDFKCVTETVTQNPIEGKVRVTFYKDLNGKIELTEVEHCCASMQALGDWSKYADLDPESQVLFNKAMEGFVGVAYTPYAVSEQIVNGKNYRFKCKSVSATNPPVEGEAIVNIYVDLDGNVTLGKIEVQ